MNEGYVTYRRFTDVRDAEPLAVFLVENKIDCTVEEVSAGNLDPLYIGYGVEKDFRVKLHKEDFVRADTLLQQYYQQDMDAMPQDYYLFGFNNPELMEIIAKRDEWGVLDFLLARRILQQRGIDISEEKLDELKTQRITELARPEKTDMMWVNIGYVATFAGCIMELYNFVVSSKGGNPFFGPYSMVGCIAGVFIGYSLLLQKTLPNGEKVYVYAEAGRQHGKRIVIFSIVLMLLWIMFKFYQFYTAVQ
jgi:hypothetical protein